MSTAIGSQDPNSGRPKVGSGIPSNREHTVASQVNTLLGVVSTYASILAQTRGVESETSDLAPALSQRTRTSTECVMVQANNLLYSILNDNSRWTMEGYDGLAAKLKDIYAAQKSLFDEQRAKVAMDSAPHARYQPRIARDPVGGWVVFLGDIESDQAVIGRGLTLKQALEDFDITFNERPTPDQQTEYDENLKRWALDRGRSETPKGHDRRREYPDGSSGEAAEPNA